MTFGNGNELDTEIIGLAQNSKYSDVKREIPPVFFRPYRRLKNWWRSAFTCGLRSIRLNCFARSHQS